MPTTQVKMASSAQISMAGGQPQGMGGGYQQSPQVMQVGGSNQYQQPPMQSQSQPQVIQVGGGGQKHVQPQQQSYHSSGDSQQPSGYNQSSASIQPAAQMNYPQSQGTVVYPSSQGQGAVVYPSSQGGTQVYPSSQGGTQVYPSSQGGTQVYPSQGTTQVYPSGGGATQVYPSGQGATQVYPSSQGTTQVYPSGGGGTQVYPSSQGGTQIYPSGQTGGMGYPSNQGGTVIYPSGQGATPIYPSSQGGTQVYPSGQGQGTVIYPSSAGQTQAYPSQPQKNSYQPTQTDKPSYGGPGASSQMVEPARQRPPKSTFVYTQPKTRGSRSGSMSRAQEELESQEPPKFVKHPEPRIGIREGDGVLLTARVVPSGDSSLQVEWYKDGRPLTAGSRFNTSFDRGYAVLQIVYTFPEDSGEYSCVAKSNFGMDQTTPALVALTVDERVDMQTQLPDESTVIHLNALEGALGQPRYRPEDREVHYPPPQIIKPLSVQPNVKEGQTAHFKSMVGPGTDPHLEVEWFKNGHPVSAGCRFNVIHDREFAVMDILYCYAEDTGTYFFTAKNQSGQAQSNAVNLNVIAEESIVTGSALPPESVHYLQSLDAPNDEQGHYNDFRYQEIEEANSPPCFDIRPKPVTVDEGSPGKFLVKIGGYPRPEIYWYLNGELISVSSSYRVYHDGSINYLEFYRCSNPGEHQIKVLAVNQLGQIEADTTLTVYESEDFRPELKHVSPENPFKKMMDLRKAEHTPELEQAFRRPRPAANNLRQIELTSEMKASTYKSHEVAEAENLYASVQSRLRRREDIYSGSHGQQHAQPTQPMQQTYQQQHMTQQHSQPQSQQMQQQQQQRPAPQMQQQQQQRPAPQMHQQQQQPAHQMQQQQQQQPMSHVQQNQQQMQGQQAQFYSVNVNPSAQLTMETTTMEALPNVSTGYELEQRPTPPPVQPYAPQPRAATNETPEEDPGHDETEAEFTFELDA